ncbi:MAG: DUF58 domain-containing protein [Planctomycetes bacterium]|nr:DUF58 domain-containing protein [Planctomycetota bacterium]
MKSTIKHQPSTIHICFAVTDAGRVILRGIGFIALAALIIPAFDVLSVLVCVLLMALAVGFVFRPRVLILGHLPERIVAGRTAHLTYTIKNVGRLPAYDLRVRFRRLPEGIEQVAPPPVTPRLRPGQTVEAALALRPTRRGRYRLRPPVCESSFPFNLFHFGLPGGAEEDVIVLPAFARLELALPYVSRPVNASSLRPAGRTGISPEYIGNRPYQPGDPPRRIDVRAWARLSVPATKEYDDDLDNYAALVLDTRLTDRTRRGSQGRKGRRRSGLLTFSLSRLLGSPRSTASLVPGASGFFDREFEDAVSLCASAAYTMYGDCQIDLLLAGTELHLLTSTPRAMRLDRLHEALAVVESADDYTAEQIGPLLEDRLSEISEVLFIVGRWDRTYQRVAEMAEQAGCHCTVLLAGERRPEAQDGSRKTEDGGQRAEDGAGLRRPSSVLRSVAGRRDAP